MTGGGAQGVRPRHETILVGVSASAASAAAVRWAAAEASLRGARLHAVHVVEHGRPEECGPNHDLRLELDLARRTVPGRVGECVFRAGLDVELAVSVVTGDVAAQLARESADASLVVVGEPDSLRRSGLPADLAAACLCPVAVVGTGGDATYVDLPVATTMATTMPTPMTTKGASHARP
jgi:nucleotide-binding universal stress UspA family protein